MPDATQMITEDHRNAEDLIERLAEAEGEQRGELTDQLVAALALHFRLEEEVLYPILRENVDEEMEEEAEAEHELARDGLRQLVAHAPDAPGFGAALEMVKAGILHHADEEEREVLPKLRETLGDEYEALGDRLMDARQRLEEQGDLSIDGKNGGRSRSRSRNGSGRSSSNGGPSKAELMEKAKKANIPGRSSMTKEQLEEALRGQ